MEEKKVEDKNSQKILSRRIRIWQIIALLIAIIVLISSIHTTNQSKTVARQDVLINRLKITIRARDERIEVLSTKLASVIDILRSTAEEMSKGAIASEDKRLIEKE